MSWELDKLLTWFIVGNVKRNYTKITLRNSVEKNDNINTKEALFTCIISLPQKVRLYFVIAKVVIFLYSIGLVRSAPLFLWGGVSLTPHMKTNAQSTFAVHRRT